MARVVASPAPLAMFALVALATACTGKDPYRPGESIGTFKVSAKLVSTTCGQTPDPWEFDVKLRHERNTLFWVQGDAPVSGLVDGAARAVLKSTDVRTVRPANEKQNLAACTMARADVVDLVLSPMTSHSGDPSGATSFKGTLTYAFSVTEGSSCDDQLLDSGGDFAALPCNVAYELVGTRTGDAK